MKLVVLTAPSGAGKTTIAKRVVEDIPDLTFSISATTRSPRPDETHGEDYFFLSEDEFSKRAAAGDFLEYEEVYPGQYYGTLREHLEETAKRHPVLLDIDVKGATNVKRIYGDAALTIFIKPPSLQVLAERLRNRETEEEEEFARRIQRAQMELGYADRFDETVVNDDLDVAVQETLHHITSFLTDE